MMTDDNKLKIPQRWTQYKHKDSGKVYMVEMVTNIASSNDNFPVTVVYQGVTGEFWSRPLTEFVEKFEIFP